MLYIENIDDCNFKMYGSTSQIGEKILSKRGVTAKAMEPAYNETQGRIRIWDAEKEEFLLQHKEVTGITLDSTVYTDSEDFVLAFNTLMELCGASVTGTVDFTDVTAKLQEVIDCVCRDCSSWYNGTVTGASETLSAGTINSCTIIVESGSVVVGNGTTTQTLVAGMSVTIEADNPLDQDIVIDATSGVAHYVVTTCTTTTAEATTTTEEVTTTVEVTTTEEVTTTVESTTTTAAEPQ